MNHLKLSVAVILTAIVQLQGFAQTDTIIVNGDMVIGEGQIFNIEPNTLVLFTDTCSILVDGGAIHAIGTADEPIIFTSNIDTSDIAATTWRGIRFKTFDNNQNADSSIFEHCTFSNAFCRQSGGAIYAAKYSNARFSNCLFSNNTTNLYGGAVYLEESNINFSYCNFVENYTNQQLTSSGAGMAIIRSAANLQFCKFLHNTSNSVGGAIIAMFCDSSRIVNCEFAYNEGTTGGAIFVSNCAYMVFSGNILHHNVGRYFGGAIGLKLSTFDIVNCTIAQNQTWQGGGFYLSSGVNCNIYNTIIAHNEILEGWNGPEVYIALLESVANFYSCVVPGGYKFFGGNGGGIDFSGEWEDIIVDEIEFIESPDGSCSYLLPPNSPCINAGTDSVLHLLLPVDILGNERIVGGTLDIGAVESSYSTSVEVVEQPTFSVYPNPASRLMVVDALQGDINEIRVLNMQGQVVRQKIIFGPKSTIDISGLNTGLYLVVVGNKSHKVIVVN